MNMVNILKRILIKDYDKCFMKKFLYCQENKNLKALKYKYDLNKIKQKYNCYIPLNAKIGENIVFPHGLNGIFISNGAIIGNNCVIFHQVTIGSNTLKDSKNFGTPIIGDNCYIGCGAKIIGNVKIGNNVRIGANCVVVKDVPENSTVVCPPNKIIIHNEYRNNKFNAYGVKDE